MEMHFQRQRPVTISFGALSAPSSTLRQAVSSGFTANALGIVVVTDLPPEYTKLRRKLLLLSLAFSELPETARERYADPGSQYSYGWSLGKETMNGKLDHSKGSYYANPVQDDRNRWPTDEIGCTEFQATVREMSKLVLEVGERIAVVCDGILDEVGGAANAKGIGMLVKESTCSKARLLHYFPPADQVLSVEDTSSLGTLSEELVDDSWCGTHIDHSIITGLVPAMYFFKPNQLGVDGTKLKPIEIPSPSGAAGLYVKARDGNTLKVDIPANSMAFQTGETLALLSSNHFEATPHFVNAASSTLSSAALARIRQQIDDDPNWANVRDGSVSRETLAVFIQPNHEEVVSKSGETFGEFTKRVLQRHYDVE